MTRITAILAILACYSIQKSYDYSLVVQMIFNISKCNNANWTRDSPKRPSFACNEKLHVLVALYKMLGLLTKILYHNFATGFLREANFERGSGSNSLLISISIIMGSSSMDSLSAAVYCFQRFSIQASLYHALQYNKKKKKKIKTHFINFVYFQKG